LVPARASFKDPPNGIPTIKFDGVGQELSGLGKILGLVNPTGNWYTEVRDLAYMLVLGPAGCTDRKIDSRMKIPTAARAAPNRL
jgi:hypothetical protein